MKLRPTTIRPWLALRIWHIRYSRRLAIASTILGLTLIAKTVLFLYLSVWLGAASPALAIDAVRVDGDDTFTFDAGIIEQTSDSLSLVEQSFTFSAEDVTEYIFDADQLVDWQTMSWKTSQPSGIGLINGQATESGYDSGNIDMSNNVLLLHMDDGSLSDGALGHEVTCVDGACPTATDDGLIDGAFTFDGANDMLTIADDDTLRLSTDQTVMTWYRWDGESASGWYRLVGKGDVTDRSYGLWIHPGIGRVLFQLYAEDRAVNGGCSARFDIAIDTEWHHLAGTYGDDSIKIYQDGVLLSEKTCTKEPVQTEEPVTIGYAGYYRAFGGEMDEVALFSDALSEQTIQDIYARGSDQISVTVQSCDDEACEGETYEEATTDLSDISTSQYLGVEAASTSSSSEVVLSEISATATGYATDVPYVTLDDALVVDDLDEWTQFVERATKPSGTELYYQLSDDGSIWQWWDGSEWHITSNETSDFNTAVAIDAQIDTFDASSEQLYVRIFFKSNGDATPIFESLDIAYTQQEVVEEVEEDADEDETSDEVVDEEEEENVDDDEQETTDETDEGTGISPVTGEEEAIVEVDPDSIIRGNSYDTIYYVSEDIERLPFFDEVTFYTWYESFEDVEVVTDATLPTLTLSGLMPPKAGVVLVKIKSDAKVYAVVESDDPYEPELRWVVSEDVAYELYGDSWSEYIIDLDPIFYDHLAVGEDIDDADDLDVDDDEMKTRDELTGGVGGGAVDEDSDDDGLSDDYELLLGTDPDNADTDGDGYDDGTELANGYSPLVAAE